MPNWKKLIVSGSDASLNSLNVTNNVTAQSFTGSFSGSFTAPGATTQVVYNSGGTLAASSNFVFSGSRVGIGTASPNSILEISQATPIIRIESSDANQFHGIEFRNGTNLDSFIKQLPQTGEFKISNGRSTGWGGHITLYTDTVERLRITSAGNVGIGTTSPASLLHINGTGNTFTRYTNTTNSGHYIDIGANGAGESFVYGYGAYPLLFGTNGSEIMRITSGGNVGIGTTSPGYKLQAVGSFQTGLGYGTFTVGGSSDWAYNITGNEAALLLTANVQNSTRSIYSYTVPPTSSNLIFGTSYGYDVGLSYNIVTFSSLNINVNKYTTAAHFASNGNVGIGTTSPTATLEVNGNVKATSFTGSFSGSITHAVSASYALSSSYALTSSYALSASYALTSSYAFTASYVNPLNQDLIVTGSIIATGGVTASNALITGNLSVLGTASFVYTTASVVTIGGNLITLNTDNPSVRFAGITVVDSGSFGNSSTGSLFWDSQNNRWIYSNPSGSSYDGGMFISGPRNTSGLGNEQGTTLNAILKGQGGDHLTSSGMFEDSSGNVGVGTASPSAKFEVIGNVKATSFTGSFSGSVSAPGSTTQIVYNSGGALAASSNFVFSGSNVGIGTATPVEKLSLAGSTGTTFGLSLEPSGWNSAKHRLTVPVSGDVSMWSFNWNGTAVDSALYAPASILMAQGTITFNTTGSANSPAARMIINSAGNVGIGTASPATKLHVVNTGAVSVIGDGNDNYFGNYSSGDYFDIGNLGSTGNVFLEGRGASTNINSQYRAKGAGSHIWTYNAGSNEIMRTTNTGYLGIGTTSPQDKLTVKGPSDYNLNLGTLGGYSGIYVYNDASNAYKELRIDAAPLILQSYSGGNVGIGTTSPTATLEVNGNVKATSFTGSFSGSVSAPGSTTQIVYNDNGVLAASSGLVYSGSNVGIGISSPTEKLHIVSSATGNQFGRITATDSTASAAWVAQNDQGDNVVYRVFGSGVSGTQMGSALGRSASLLANLGGSGVFLLGTFSNTDFILGTNNTENMRIKSGGNVGIGTSSPLTRLDLRASTNNTVTPLSTVPDTTTTLLIGNTGTNGVLALGHDNAGHPWLQGRSVLANQVAEDILINPLGGNVGIGTTSPSEKLEVQGSAQIGNDSVASAGLVFARKNSNQAKSHYFLSAQESPTYQWIEGGYFTSELAGVSVANNSGKPYYESYAPAGQAKSFGFINQQTSGSSFTSTAVTASVILYQGGNIALAPTLGNVGIGNTAPNEKLELSVGAGVTGGLRINYAASATGEGMDITYLNNGSTTTSFDSRYNSDSAVMQFRMKTAATPVTAMTILGSGNIGIGTTSPANKLDINSGTSANVFRALSSNTTSLRAFYEATSGNVEQHFLYTGNQDWVLGLDKADSNKFKLASADDGFASAKVTVTTAGNVGIGTTTPNSTFQVSKGGVTFQVTDTNKTANNSFSVYGLTQTSWAIATGNSGSFSGGEKIVITDSGNIGIGTTSPSTKLHTVGSSTTELRLQNSDANNNYGFVKYETSVAGVGGNLVIGTNASGGGYGAIGFSNNNNVEFVGNGDLYIVKSGNVGIGTYSPSQKLSVVGAVSASTYYGDGSNLTNIGSGSVAAAGSDGQLQYNNGGSFGGASRLYYNDSSNRVGIGISTPGYDLDVSGSARVTQRLRVGTINSGNGVVHESTDATINPSGAQVVWTISGTAAICTFMEYYVFNTNTNTSQRAGTIVLTWNQSGTPTITHTETSTPDIGSTSAITFTSTLTLGGDPQLIATNTSGDPWYMIMNYRYF
jgi:hypothetical protein